jgi:hypothetical protein
MVTARMREVVSGLDDDELELVDVTDLELIRASPVR